MKVIHTDFKFYQHAGPKAAVPECPPGEVRLVGGASPLEGRVEVYIDNQWGTMCDDSWDDNGAAVICKQLGYPHEGMFVTLDVHVFYLLVCHARTHTNEHTAGARMVSFGGNESLNILFDDLKCKGSESNLFECHRRNLGQVDCTHSEDVGVVCAAGQSMGVACAAGQSVGVACAVGRVSVGVACAVGQSVFMGVQSVCVVYMLCKWCFKTSGNDFSVLQGVSCAL